MRNPSGLIGLILPPLIPLATRKVVGAFLGDSGDGGEAEDLLFDGESELFETVALNSHVYAEYGVGKSTLWMLENTSAYVYAVDTSSEWVKKVSFECQQHDRLSIDWVDVGPVVGWGRPEGYTKSTSFIDYTEWPWRHQQSPDTVLIDGRFRVCCFLTSLLNASPGTRLVFDDYVDRPHYHVVEDFVTPDLVIGRQALFVVPEASDLDFGAIKCRMRDFLHVLE